MKPEAVDAMLQHYREYVGRCAYLENSIAQSRRNIAWLKKVLCTEECISLGRPLTGMPPGGRQSDPTANTALKLADCYKPDQIREEEAEIQKAEAEIRDKAPTVAFVYSWLHGLPEREAWIVEAKCIDNIPWAQTIIQYGQKFGKPVSKDTLKRLKTKAMEKVYSMAE